MIMAAPRPGSSDDKDVGARCTNQCTARLHAVPQGGVH